MAMTSVLELLESGEPQEWESRLAADVVFRSPVAEYRGRRDVAHLLGLVSRVVGEVRPGDTWRGDGEDVQAFTAEVGGSPVDGMVRERWAPSGELSCVTLFLRPYRALSLAIEQMGALMSESPLPSRSSGSEGRPQPAVSDRREGISGP